MGGHVITICDDITAKASENSPSPSLYGTWCSHVVKCAKERKAVQTSVLIVRAFVAIRQLISQSPVERVGQLESQVKELKEYIEEVFADYNDINDDTRMQMELINQTLAELQTQKKLDEKPRNPIGFRK